MEADKKEKDEDSMKHEETEEIQKAPSVQTPTSRETPNSKRVPQCAEDRPAREIVAGQSCRLVHFDSEKTPAGTKRRGAENAEIKNGEKFLSCSLCSFVAKKRCSFADGCGPKIRAERQLRPTFFVVGPSCRFAHL